MQPPDLGAMAPNTLGVGAAAFMIAAWTFTLGLLAWSFRKLIRMPPKTDD